jgi:hypothetical protein
VHVRVGLGTLLGLDHRPGEIAGLGQVPASVARSLTTRQRRAEWRYAIVDEAGQPLFDGVTRRRPRGPRPGAEPVHGGIVELHVARELVTDPELGRRYPQWAHVLSDLAAQYAEQAPIEQDATARFAGRPLRRRQQTRFQRCTFRGCRRPASDCDLDHRQEHVRGGRTDEENLEPDCRHDHRLKTSGGWRVVRRNQQTCVWISPLGRKHVVTLGPIAPPLPEPIPRPLPAQPPTSDEPDPGPTFKPFDARGRPLAPAGAGEPVPMQAVESGSDPPPF